MLEESLRERLEMLEKNAELIKKRINKYPQGYLKINVEKGGFYYRIADKENGNYKYVRKEDISNVGMIAQRDYEQDYLETAEREIGGIKRLLSRGCLEKTKDCYSKLHSGRKCFVKPIELSDEEYCNRWMSIPYTPKEFSEMDTTNYYTEKGERVRSKSEVIIANILSNLNIPYKYECPLKLGGITVYPDFTVLDVAERREKYWEHFGMMDDMDYVAKMMSKISSYEKDGIYIGDTLICTLESSMRPLDVNVVRNKIRCLLN